jgi:hypothetical protein
MMNLKIFSDEDKVQLLLIYFILFYIQLITTLTCECRHSNFYFQKIIDIPLLIPVNYKQTSLINLLNNYFNTELVEVTYSCESYKSKKNFQNH